MMSPVREIIYPILEKLAVIEPTRDETENQLDQITRLAGRSHGFNIIFTARPQGSVPISLWSSSHLIFMDSL